MGLHRILIRLALLVGALYLGMQGLMHFAPAVPERYEGVTVAAPPPARTSTTTPPPLPPGFPSMERPPPKIEVPDGEPQPIATKFGLTYYIPADWRNFSTGIAGWSTGGRSVVYGAIGDYGYKYCPESDGSALALSGMTGRNGVTIEVAALEAARDADVVFGDDDAAPPVLDYSDPYFFEIEGEPAVRYTVRASHLHQREPCDPLEATLDVVATTGHATATVAVFMIELHQNLDDSLAHSVADTMISTIRRTEKTAGVPE